LLILFSLLFLMRERHAIFIVASYAIRQRRARRLPAQRRCCFDSATAMPRHFTMPLLLRLRHYFDAAVHFLLPLPPPPPCHACCRHAV
jgi:hypothetical protein